MVLFSCAIFFLGSVMSAKVIEFGRRHAMRGFA
jgi:hypothetical protein